MAGILCILSGLEFVRDLKRTTSSLFFFPLQRCGLIGREEIKRSDDVDRGTFAELNGSRKFGVLAWQWPIITL